jgi:hypothetical protein
MKLSRISLAKGLLLASLLGAIPAGLLGCGPGGAGTVEIKDAEAARKKMEGDSPASKKISAATQTQNKTLEEEAGKKHPKLR